jgi:hypothetical protein
MPPSRIYASGSARQKIKGAAKAVVIPRLCNRMSASASISDGISRLFNSGRLLTTLLVTVRGRLNCAHKMRFPRYVKQEKRGENNAC